MTEINKLLWNLMTGFQVRYHGIFSVSSPCPKQALKISLEHFRTIVGYRTTANRKHSLVLYKWRSHSSQI